MNTYYSREGRMDYSPALLGNGEISLQLDFMGQQVFEEKELDTGETPPARSVASPNIWWAGRRYVYDIFSQYSTIGSPIQMCSILEMFGEP